MAKRKRRRLKKQARVGLIAISLTLAGALALLLTPIFNVSNITVHGNKVVSDEEIIRASGVIEGTNIFGVSLRRVRDNLESMGRISSVKAKRSLPSTISITVEESTPMVYVYNNGDCVGITADGRVVNTVASSFVFDEDGSAEAKASDGKNKGGKDSSTGHSPEGNSDEDDEDGESSAKDTETESADRSGNSGGDGEDEDEPKSASGLDRPIVTGMGGIKKCVIGEKIVFADETKSASLFKLMNEFLCDDVCRGISRVNMSVYDNVTMVYGDSLNINIGPAEELGFKLKSFKAIMAEQLDEDSSGTLDLERLTYNPKKK